MAKEGSIACYHCGEDCVPTPIPFDSKSFCCSGCRTVYEILSQNGACDYYDLNTSPGIKANSRETGNRYAYLDQEEIRKEILEFSDGGISTVKFFIPGIHCSSCIWLLENLGKLQKGIAQSHVNFAKKEISITFHDDSISLRQLVELLVSVNYIPEISMDNVRKKTKRKVNNSIYFRLGVAGFCFGNIMLFSFPEYLAGGDFIEGVIVTNLRWFNLIFSLPVILYSGNIYIISAWKGIKKNFISIDVPIALGILALFLRSAYEILSNSGPGFMDSLAGLVFFLLIGKWYQGKTYEALSFERDYESYFPVSVTVLNDDGEETIIPLGKIKIGQRILIRNQELIPADGLLVKGEGNLDYSFVSGESNPVNKATGDRIFAGGRQLGSSIEIIVEKEVAQSYLTELWNRETHEKFTNPKITTLISRISKRFTYAVILISTGSAIAWFFIDPSVSINAFTSVLIVACPCALALSMPFAYGNTMRIFGRNGFYLKETQVVEILSNIDTIVFDKTGTLTQNDDFDISWDKLNLDAKERELIMALAKQSTHPVSSAIYKSRTGIINQTVEKFEEIVSQGISGIVEGNTIKLGSSAFVNTNSTAEQNADGNRVFVSFNNELNGYILLKNKYRQGFSNVISLLGRDYDLHVLSGDNEAERERLSEVFGSSKNMFFKQTPHDKLEYVRKLKLKGATVLMVGDGLNDAGALQESDLGVSIADDVYHFSPACDGILDSGRFETLGNFIRFSKTSVKIVKFSILISLLYNITGTTIAAFGLLTPIIAAILMPLSSVTVVVFVTLSTSYLANKRGISKRYSTPK